MVAKPKKSLEIYTKIEVARFHTKGIQGVVKADQEY